MPTPLDRRIKPKEELKFDLEKLDLEDTTNTLGNDGEDPRVRHMKKIAETNPRVANKIFEKMQKHDSKRAGFEWLDRIKRTDVGKPLDAEAPGT